MKRKRPWKNDWYSESIPAKKRTFVRIVRVKAPAIEPSALPRPPKKLTRRGRQLRSM